MAFIAIDLVLQQCRLIPPAIKPFFSIELKYAACPVRIVSRVIPAVHPGSLELIDTTLHYPLIFCTSPVSADYIKYVLRPVVEIDVFKGIIPERNYGAKGVYVCYNVNPLKQLHI